ncbi:hypothetical protein ACHAXS_012248 [Conticribra weissflogii]
MICIQRSPLPKVIWRISCSLPRQLRGFSSKKYNTEHHGRLSSNKLFQCLYSSSLSPNDLHFPNILPLSKLGESHPNLTSFHAAIAKSAQQPAQNTTIKNGNRKTVESSSLIILTNSQKRQILLGKKLRGFGTGKYNGFGGRLEAPEIDLTPAHGAKRELLEETNISIPLHVFEKGSVGVLTFTFEDKRDFSMVVHLFHVDVRIETNGNGVMTVNNASDVGETQCSKKKVESTVVDPNLIRPCDEIIPEWFEWSNIPLDKMFADDSIWLTRFLSTLAKNQGGTVGKNADKPIRFNGWFHFSPGGDQNNLICHHFLDFLE